MKLEGSITLFRYWNRLRGNRAAPRRSEIQPADIKTLLADILIIEKRQRDEFAFRLAGTGVCETFGKELKGVSFGSLWAEKEQPGIKKLVRGTCEAKFVACLSVEGMTAEGQAARFELLLLPLDDPEGPHALGALLPCDAPFWLGTDAIIAARILRSRIIEPERYARTIDSRLKMQAPPLAPGEIPATSDRDTAPGGRRFRHLVIFDGGRES